MNFEKIICLQYIKTIFVIKIRDSIVFLKNSNCINFLIYKRMCMLQIVFNFILFFANANDYDGLLNIK